MGRRRAQDGDTVRERLRLAEKSGPLGERGLRCPLFPALFTSAKQLLSPRLAAIGAEASTRPSPALRPSPPACHLLHAASPAPRSSQITSLAKSALRLGQECQQEVKSMARAHRQGR